MKEPLQVVGRPILAALVVALLSVGTPACGGTSCADTGDQPLPPSHVCAQGFRFEVEPGSDRMITRVVITNSMTQDEIREDLRLSDLSAGAHFVPLPEPGFYAVQYFTKLKSSTVAYEIGPIQLLDPDTDGLVHEIRPNEVVQRMFR